MPRVARWLGHSNSLCAAWLPTQAMPRAHLALPCRALPHCTHVPASPPHPQSIYWASVTLTTVGYGARARVCECARVRAPACVCGGCAAQDTAWLQTECAWRVRGVWSVCPVGASPGPHCPRLDVALTALLPVPILPPSRPAGDVTPTYWATQVMIIALLALTFSVLPYLTSQFMDALMSSSKYQRKR